MVKLHNSGWIQGDPKDNKLYYGLIECVNLATDCTGLVPGLSY